MIEVEILQAFHQMEKEIEHIKSHIIVSEGRLEMLINLASVILEKRQDLVMKLLMIDDIFLKVCMKHLHPGLNGILIRNIFEIKFAILEKELSHIKTELDIDTNKKFGIKVTPEIISATYNILTISEMLQNMKKIFTAKWK